jgi:metal-responsive CopG/Arc/MetJ family transcriptional regulator
MLWCMERTNIYLTNELRAAVDARARAEGLSRAEVIRRLLDRALRDEVDDLRSDLAAISEAFGVLRDEPVDVDRSDGARGAHLERIAAL